MNSVFVDANGSKRFCFLNSWYSSAFLSFNTTYTISNSFFHIFLPFIEIHHPIIPFDLQLSLKRTIFLGVEFKLKKHYFYSLSTFYIFYVVGGRSEERKKN